MYKYLFLTAVVVLIAPVFTFAQELYEDIQGVWRAEVIEITNERTVTVPGTDVENQVQTITAELLEGGERRRDGHL